MIIKAIVAGVVWIALVTGADYFTTGMNNDTIDAFFGQVAGVGFSVIVITGAILSRFKKR